MTKFKVYTFRVDDPKLIEIIENIPKKERSKYIRNAIIMYESISKKLDAMDKKIDRILTEGIALKCQQDSIINSKNQEHEDLLAKSLEFF